MTKKRKEFNGVDHCGRPDVSNVGSIYAAVFGLRENELPETHQKVAAAGGGGGGGGGVAAGDACVNLVPPGQCAQAVGF